MTVSFSQLLILSLYYVIATIRLISYHQMI
jgi:hypothetical protein